MNCDSIFFWMGKYTNELEDIRMNWKIYEWGSFFLEDIRMNWKIYE